MEFVKVRWLRPLLGRLALDRCDLFEREEFLTVLWQPYGPGKLLTRSQMVLLNEPARDAYVLGDRQEVQFRPAQHCERVVHLVEETLGGNSRPGGQCGPNDVQNVLMMRARRV
jgi:hypothetical protein